MLYRKLQLPAFTRNDLQLITADATPHAASTSGGTASPSAGDRCHKRPQHPASSLHASASEHTLPMHTNPLQVAAALAPKLESSSDRFDVCTGSGSSAGSGDTALGSASDGALSTVVCKDSSSTTTTDASTDSGHVCPDASMEARSPGTVKLKDEACMDDQKVKAFIKQHGLTLCIPQRELGKGAFGHVEMVIITLPDGTTVKAARKTLHACETKGAVAALRRILNQELAGLAAAAGCEHAPPAAQRAARCAHDWVDYCFGEEVRYNIQLYFVDNMAGTLRAFAIGARPAMDSVEAALDRVKMNIYLPQVRGLGAALPHYRSAGRNGAGGGVWRPAGGQRQLVRAALLDWGERA
eukprot:XP_001696889.1 predicted protein [Chlamydomonas reinhardtii]